MTYRTFLKTSTFKDKDSTPFHFRHNNNDYANKIDLTPSHSLYPLRLMPHGIKREYRITVAWHQELEFSGLFEDLSNVET